jgi:hypothetical protein
MVYRGHVKSGQIVLDEGVALPEGAEVNIELLKSDAPQTSVWEALQQLAGTVEGPEDWAENHDHYIHGTPKRQ